MLSVLSNKPHRSFAVFEEELSRVNSQALFFFAKLLHAQPEHASGELSPRAARNEGVPYCNNKVGICNRAGGDKN